MYYFAYLGKGKYEGQPQKYLRAMVPLYAEPIHFMVAKGSGIKDLKSLKRYFNPRAAEMARKLG